MDNDIVPHVYRSSLRFNLFGEDVIVAPEPPMGLTPIDDVLVPIDICRCRGGQPAMRFLSIDKLKRLRRLEHFSIGIEYLFQVRVDDGRGEKDLA